MEDTNNTWTKPGQNLDKTWTKPGQNLDKTFCPVLSTQEVLDRTVLTWLKPLGFVQVDKTCQSCYELST